MQIHLIMWQGWYVKKLLRFGHLVGKTTNYERFCMF